MFFPDFQLLASVSRPYLTGVAFGVIFCLSVHLLQSSEMLFCVLWNQVGFFELLLPFYQVTAV